MELSLRDDFVFLVFQNHIQKVHLSFYFWRADRDKKKTHWKIIQSTWNRHQILLPLIIQVTKIFVFSSFCLPFWKQKSLNVPFDLNRCQVHIIRIYGKLCKRLYFSYYFHIRLTKPERSFTIEYLDCKIFHRLSWRKTIHFL